jgi:hypothetical protein
MSTLAPRALPENSSLAFVGERVRAAAAIPEALARRMRATRNPHGRPSDEVVRRFVSAPTPRALREQWMVDFPPGMDEREAALFVMPYEHLRRTLGQATQGPWWMNPFARRELRAALARVGRYLAAPASGPPVFRWVESDLLPDDSLVVVARDDDWMAAVLASRAFGLWWDRHHTRRDPARSVATFPFPWAPDTALNALSREREEVRFALARAGRGDDREAVESAVAAAYGWPAGADDAALLARLSALNLERAG